MLLAVGELGLVADLPLALVEQLGDLEFARQRALAPHLGRMRRQHRADESGVEEFAQGFGRDAGFARALEGVGQRTRPRRRALHDVGAVAADVVLVLGDIGQMREIAERAHDRERLVVVEAVERRGEFAPRAGLVVAVEADRGLPDALDEIEGLGALLLAHGVAENASEQADVVAQRRVLLVVFPLRPRGAFSSDGDRHGNFPCGRAPAWA